MSQLATYSKFHSPEDAQFLVTLLQQRNIPYALEHEVNQLDKVYIGESIDPMFALQIPTDRFNEVNGLLAEQAKFDMTQPGFEHILQTSTTEELREILTDPTGWNAYDIQVASSLLAEKTQGRVTIPVKDLSTYVPLKLELGWIILGYLLSAIGTSFFFFGIAGFLAGLTVNQAKKTLKNGSIVKMYSQKSRMHGRIMMIIGAFTTVIGLSVVIFRINIWGEILQRLGE